MKLKSTVLLLGAIAFLSGCGGTKQDPYADASPEIQAALNKGAPKPAVPKPDAPNMFLIDTPPYKSLREGEDLDLTITSRSMYDNSKYYIDLKNAGDFKGLTYTTDEGDTATGKLASLKIKWKVPTGIAGNDVVEIPFVFISATTNLKPNAGDEKTFLLYVYNQTKNIPVVTKIDGPATAIRENTEGVFKVYVTDLDGQDVDGKRPQLLALPDNNKGLNGSAYLFPQKPVRDPAVANGWIFDVKVNLKNNAEVTANNAKVFYYLQVVSQYSKISSTFPGNFDVWTSVSNPVSSWTEAVYFTRQQKNNHTFTVTDPKGEGQISARFTNCGGIDGAPTCTCKVVAGFAGNAKGAAQCTIIWTPPADGGFFSFTPSNQTFTVEVTNTTPVFVDTEKKVVNLNGVINLVN